MTTRQRFSIQAGAVLLMLAGSACGANAAQCSSSGGGFEGWKEDFANEARAHGVGEAGISALMNTDRKSTRLNSSHIPLSRMPSSA